MFGKLQNVSIVMISLKMSRHEKSFVLHRSKMAAALPTLKNSGGVATPQKLRRPG
jgi:hypothetical protein